MKWTEEREVLLGSDWFRPLPENLVDQLAAMMQRRRLGDGEQLYAKGDAPDGLYCVRSGLVRNSATSADGRELLLMQYTPGSWFGEIAMFDGLGRTHNAHAVGETEILILPRQRFLDFLARHPDQYPHFIRMICRKLRLAFAYIDDAQFVPLTIRLARRLLDLVVLYGRPSNNGMLIDLHLPQDDLGRTLGVSRQAISKELKHWEARGWIGLQYGRFEICNPEALQRIADGDTG